MTIMATTVDTGYLKLVQKQRKVMAINASYKFRLSALVAIDNTVSEQFWV